VKSCRCIVALKAAASFRSFDIVVGDDLMQRDITVTLHKDLKKIMVVLHPQMSGYYILEQHRQS
jgi:hypothetical protein